MTEPCDEMHLLLQAELDGELDAARAAGLAGHLADCPACAATRAQLGALSTRLREEISYHRAPAALHAAFAPPPVVAAPPVVVKLARPPRRRWMLPFGGGAGLALAACTAFLLLVRVGPDLTGEIVDGHIRALQPGHLMDVVSTDQHTVKPWFDGRIDFAPPVRDFPAQGFPLVGGRIDYVDGHAVAVLIYRRDKHLIDLSIWPATAKDAVARASGERDGYNYVRWQAGGFVFWAVSDVEAAQLADFTTLWR